MTSSSQQSISIEIRPADRRCGYWAKRIDAGTALSLPDSISGARDIPGPFLRVGGEDELAVGDFIIEGEKSTIAINADGPIALATWASMARYTGSPQTRSTSRP